jgi:hypothetical protein
MLQLEAAKKKGSRRPGISIWQPISSVFFLYLINTDIFISNLLAAKYVISRIVIYWLETWYSNNNLYTHYLE